MVGATAIVASPARLLALLIALPALPACAAGSGSGGGGGGVPVGGSCCGPCPYHDECDALSVCHAGKCMEASGLTHRFTFLGATIPYKDAKGRSWDPSGGAPDVKMRLFKGNDVVCTTSTVQDDYAPVWNESCSTRVTFSDEINFTMVDQDLFSDDLMGGVTFSDTIGMLRSGGGTVDLGNKISLTWEVAPK